MAISVTDLKNGKVYEENGQPLLVTKYSHTKMGRGMATIKVKVKNLKTGSITEKSYNSGARVDEADVVRRNMQYLYPTGDGGGVFMDMDTFEQSTVDASIVGDALHYLTEGSSAIMMLYEGQPISMELPKNVTLTVAFAEPGVKGNTATNALMKVELETGLEIMTPLFIKTGDTLKVDTRTGEYLERVG